MKNVFSLVIATVMSSAAYGAEVNLADDFYAYGYMGVNLGSTPVSPKNGSQGYRFLTAGFSVGYQFTPFIAVEGLIVVPTSGKKDNVTSSILDERVEAEYSAYGVYLNAKTRGDWFVKGRLGLALSQFSYSADGYKDEDGNDIGFSYGVGGGYKNGQYSYELDYIVFPDVDDPFYSSESYEAKTISFSLSFQF